MSANEGRLRSAIQRIAREDPEIRGTIDAFKDRGGFDSVSTQVAGADDDRQICCDGSSSGNRNPGSDTRDPSDNAKDGLDPDDPADISDNLTGVVDCETGQPICFEGSDFIPPEGWEDARTPPDDPTWQEGFYWRLRTAVNGNFSESYHASCGSASGGLAAHLDQCDPPFAAPGCSAGLAFGAGCGDEEDNVYEGYVQRFSCINTTNEFFCTEEAPKLEEWPDDGCVNLIATDGYLVGSKYDPENDGGYSAPRKEIELCDANGSRILVRADTDSTWKSIKSLDGDIDPDTQSGYLYDTATGKRIRQISPSEFRDNTV